MDKFEEFYKEHCLDHFGYNPDLNWIFEKHEDGSYIQIEVENTKKVYQHQQAKVDELQTIYTQQGINMLKMQKRMELALGLLNTNNEDFPIKLVKADLNKVLRLDQPLKEDKNYQS